MPSLACSRTAEGSHRIKKIDRCPFLDAALQFLFAIAETHSCTPLGAKEPAFIAPHIQEFYTFSKNAIQKSKKGTVRRNRTSITLLKTFRILGFSQHQPKFQTCINVVLEALFAYRLFLCSVSVEIKEEATESAIQAFRWYIRRYFPDQLERVWIAERHFLKRMDSLQSAYIPFEFSEDNVGQYLAGTQRYFSSAEFKGWWEIFLHQSH